MYRIALSLMIGLGLLISGATAQAGGKKDKPVHGIVQKVDKQDGKDGVFLVIEVMNKKKDDTTAAEKQEARVQVLPTTKIEKVSGKKDNLTRTEAKIDDLKVGQLVVVTGTNGKADKVEVMTGKKKK